MEKAALLQDDFGDTREERAFRMWMNSSGLERYMNDLFVDCRDGIALLQVHVHVCTYACPVPSASASYSTRHALVVVHVLLTSYQYY